MTLSIFTGRATLSIDECLCAHSRGRRAPMSWISPSKPWSRKVTTAVAPAYCLRLEA
jgi:hypothetical protein